MLIKNKFCFPLILFFSIYLFFCLNWNFGESKNLESRKLEILKFKENLNKGGRKFNFNKTEKLNSRKLNGEDEFFVDFAMTVHYEYDSIQGWEFFYYMRDCFDEEKYFKKYCDLDKMSKPINATFDERKLDKIEIFVDEVVDSKGETLINVGKNTTFILDDEYLGYKAIQGSSENIEKIRKALQVKIDKEYGYYYLDGRCRDYKPGGKLTIGLKLKNANTTINVYGKNMANKSHVST
ncbi:unnamed protein product [Meloidogyne enterolobii]|uniref:Uncharacterized protein n=1 Tax=Meloidogyne enterolobii TaxID=390850 RepID=A0ACB0YMW4_MELEN